MKIVGDSLPMYVKRANNLAMEINENEGDKS
jgi:hypothetical protein